MILCKEVSISKSMPRMVIITGLSGAGKSLALKVLEDIGFFCVDNLPITLFPKFLELCAQSSEGITRVAIVVDVREGEFLKDIASTLEELKRKGYKTEILFLESNDEVIIRRFKETRRRHPLAGEGSLLDGIRLEREKLNLLKSMSDKIIDTSELTVHRLKEILNNYFYSLSKDAKVTINLVSFSYKYGLPSDADIVLDVRFLPNPFFEEGLKELTGNDKKVQDYILNNKETKVFLSKIISFIEYLFPLYVKEGKPYITVAIGCTGGRHRSVCIVNHLNMCLKGEKYVINKRHRDVDK